MGEIRARVAESLDELWALDRDIASWHAWWDTSYAISKHRTQLELLAALSRGLIDILISDTSKIDLTEDARTVYAQCRQSDERLHYVRKLWRYYADKFDQRAGPETDPMTRTLRAADEVVWSCWKTALNHLGSPPGFRVPGPLAYLSSQFSAATTHRTEYPSDLRKDRHAVFARHIEQLAIPVIALPPVCQRRPWWLVIAAHEVGHHVQWALPGVEDRTKDAITAAVDDSTSERWLAWNRELFADACAVLLMGRAVIWAIAELETRSAPGPSHRYPPPQVRLAMVRAVAERAGLQDSAAVDPLPSGDAGPAGLLRSVPAVANALLGVTSDSGAELRGLANETASAAGMRVIRYWAEALLRPGAPVPRSTLSSARFCAAGSVAAWQSVASQDSTDQELADRTAFLAGQVREVLPGCAEPGTRAGRAGADVKSRAADLAARFAADLYAIDMLTDDESRGEL